MATLLPPSKRQKLYNGVPKPEKSPEPSPNVVVQFVSEDDGFALSPAVSLPANVSREDLQSLVNTLTSKVCFIERFTFHILNTIDIPRPMNPCLSNSMSRYQGMPRLKNPRESWSPSRSRPMCFHTLPTRSRQRIFLSSAVLHSPCSALDQLRDVLLLCQVKVVVSSGALTCL